MHELKDIQFTDILRLSPPLSKMKLIRTQSGKHLILFNDSNSEPRNAVLLGKVKEITPGGELLNANVWLDVSKPKIILVFGRRGSGKSYDLGLIIEGLAIPHNNIRVGSYAPPILIFDPLNQFWTLSEPPSSEDPEEKGQLELLRKWGLDPAFIDKVTILVPKGTSKRHPNAVDFSISPASLGIDEWCGLFGVDKYNDPIGQLLNAAHRKVVSEGSPSESGKSLMESMIVCIENDQEINDPNRGFAVQTRRAVISRLRELSVQPLFQDDAEVDIGELFDEKKVSVIMLREVDENTRSVVVSLTLKRILTKRGLRWESEEIAKKLLTKAKLQSDNAISETMKKQAEELIKDGINSGIPAGWVVLDEAHTLCPAVGYSASRDQIIEYAKQGRAMGLSLLAATQQPSALSSRLISQRDLIIVHHLGIKADIDAALSQMNPNFADSIIEGRDTITSNIPYRLLNALTKGEAVVSCDELSRNFIIRLRPRVSSHGGKEPVFT